MTGSDIDGKPCCKCGQPAVESFNICALDYRKIWPVCRECDIEINELVVRFIFGKRRERALERYRERQQQCASSQ